MTFFRETGPMLKKRELPHDVLLEFLGGVSFCRNEEHDVKVAEDIASRSYSSLTEAIQVAKGFVEQGKREKAFDIYVKQCKKNKFYQPYL